MSPKKVRDLSASVLARLLSRAKRTGDDYQNLITAFLCERFLYRLGVSGVRDRFALKGAMLLRLWSDRIRQRRSCQFSGHSSCPSWKTSITASGKSRNGRREGLGVNINYGCKKLSTFRSLDIMRLATPTASGLLLNTAPSARLEISPHSDAARVDSFLLRVAAWPARMRAITDFQFAIWREANPYRTCWRPGDRLCREAICQSYRKTCSNPRAFSWDLPPLSTQDDPDPWNQRAVSDPR
jgi:hypothetical protein